MELKKRLFKLFILFLLPQLAVAQKSIDYTLSMSEPHTHYFEVEIKMQGVKGKHIDMKMPAWTPGSYMIREYAKHVDYFEAFDSEKKPLSFDKVSKNTWRISNPKNGIIYLRYKVYAFEMSVRHSFLDDSHGYINGTTLFLYPAGKTHLPSTLTVIPHHTFAKIACGLERVNADNPWVLIAQNYDQLVDSPIEIGNHLEFEFNAAGVKHEVALYGEANVDIEKLKVDMAKIVEVCTEIFGGNPNKRYVFIIHNLAQGGGGLEHMNSTTLQVTRNAYEPGRRYNGFLSLTAHEYFHLWNVKRIRAKELGPFDYDNENYTSLLWVMEGFTAYYDEILLRRAKFYSEEEIIKEMQNKINYVENQPGNKHQSLAMASFDAWIRFYRGNENSVNTEVSYYSKGALAAMVLDLMIVNASNGTKNLDDVMRYLYNEYYKNKKRGFTESEMQLALEKFTGTKMDSFFANYIRGTETLPYTDVFEGVGLMFLLDTLNKPEFGAVLNEYNNRLFVKQVKKGTTAFAGGVNTLDEIVSINGESITTKVELEKVISASNIGDKIELIVIRNANVRSLTMEILQSNTINYVLADVDKLSDEQIRNRKKWLTPYEN